MCQDTIAANGWTSVPADAGKLLFDKSLAKGVLALALSDVKFPSNDAVVAKAYDYASNKLHKETLNHSMRVYYYGNARVSRKLDSCRH